VGPVGGQEGSGLDLTSPDQGCEPYVQGFAVAVVKPPLVVAAQFGQFRIGRVVQRAVELNEALVLACVVAPRELPGHVELEHVLAAECVNA
jgi:hypothetical protein